MGPAYLLFDVGGTDIKAALADEDGTLLDIRRSATPRHPHEPAQAVVAELVGLQGQLQAAHPDRAPTAAGLVVCGIVDEAAGVGVFSSNLGWRNAPLQSLASQQLGLPTGFGHDVSAAGEAELAFGAGRGLGRAAENSAMLVIGTGIAGTLFADGRRIRAGGYAGEIGHSAVPGGEDCPCGAHGCLETVGSAAAIARRYARATGQPVAGARQVVERMQAGDPAAAAVWTDAIQALAFATAQLSALLAPETVIIGGGLAQAGETLLGPLREAVGRRLSFHRRPNIVPAQLGQDAGLKGAYLTARSVPAAGRAARGAGGPASPPAETTIPTPPTKAGTA